jgi:hypothetical protein
MRRTFLYALAAAAALATSVSAQAQNGPGYITDGTLNMPTQSQGATFSFSASAGQYIAVTIQEQDSNISSLQLRIVDPNFSPIYNQTFTAPPNGGMGTIGCAVPGGTAGCWANIVANLGPIATTAAGSYLVIVTPVTGSGSVKFTVTSPLMMTGLMVNGGSLPKSSIYPGQSLMMAASLVAGQNYTLTINETNGYSPGNQGKVLHPNGNAIGTFFEVATCPNPCGLGQYSGSGWVAFTAPISGTYNFLLQQLTQSSGPNVYGPILNTSTFTLTSP